MCFQELPKSNFVSPISIFFVTFNLNSSRSKGMGSLLRFFFKSKQFQQSTRVSSGRLFGFHGRDNAFRHIATKPTHFFASLKLFDIWLLKKKNFHIRSVRTVYNGKIEFKMNIKETQENISYRIATRKADFKSYKQGEKLQIPYKFPYLILNLNSFPKLRTCIGMCCQVELGSTTYI